MQPIAASPSGLPTSFEGWSKLPVPARRVIVGARRWSHPSRRAHPTVAVEMVDGVAVMTLDDGKVNAISPRMIEIVSDALDELEAGDARALVLAGRPGQFCAGFDLFTLMVGGSRRDALVLDGWNLLLRVFTLPLPVVAACTGHAIAAGAVLLLLSDVRLGADGAFKIGFNEATLGIPLPGVLLLLARDQLTDAVIEEALQGARIYGPAGAVDAGLLERVVAPADLLDVAITAARELGDKGDTFRQEKHARVGPLADRMRHQLTEDIELLSRFTI
jgi:enoyl-CoA hydratase